MRRLFKITITAILVVLVALTTASCKKQEVKKIAVDNHFAIAIFNDTVTIRDLLNDVDSTCNSWMRVRNDSIFAYYADSVNGILKASDLLDAGIEDIDFTTTTAFTMPAFEPTNNHDTVIDVARFMTIPFNYDGFSIDSVILRHGLMTFDFNVMPTIECLKRIELYSNHLLSPDGNPLVIPIDYPRRGQTFSLADFRVIPEQDTVAFGARITIHVDNGEYPGGVYDCVASGGLINVGFKTVYALVTKALDSIFTDQTAIDFGINGLSGSAHLPVPKIQITYRNTFGMTADGDINKLHFVNGRTGLVTDLLVVDHVDVDLFPTNGLYRHFTLTGFTDQIDALAGYTRLDFDGRVTMAMPGEHISISDTSSVDVIADVEMPLSFRITDLRYIDTVNIDFGNTDFFVGSPWEKTIWCYNRGGDGVMDVKGALTRSCNISLAQMSEKIGIDIFCKYQRKFGFGQYTEIDLPNEMSCETLLYTTDNMTVLDLATNAFGQNFNTTMIQLGTAFCSIVNGGYLYRPYVVKDIYNSNNELIKSYDKVLVAETISQGTCDYVKECLRSVVTDGTGQAAAVSGYKIAGKTGTAQKYDKTEDVYLISFIGFAPYDDPQVVCYVAIDEPATGDVSGYSSQLFHNIMVEVLSYMNIAPDDAG